VDYRHRTRRSVDELSRARSVGAAADLVDPPSAHSLRGQHAGRHLEVGLEESGDVGERAPLFAGGDDPFSELVVEELIGESKCE